MIEFLKADRKSKQVVTKILLIIVLLSPDIGITTGIGNLSFIIVSIIVVGLTIWNLIFERSMKLKYLTPEYPVYASIIVISIFMLLYITDLKNVVHVVKLFTIFFLIYPVIRGVFSSVQIMTALKINLVLNLLLIIMGKLGIEIVSRLTGSMRGSTILNYAGSLYKVGLILIPYLVWDLLTKKEQRLNNLILLGASLYIMLFDGSRTGIISIAIIALVYLLVGLNKLIKSGRIKMKSLLSNIIILIIIGVITINNYERLINSNAYIRVIKMIQLFTSFDINEILMKADKIRGRMILDALSTIKDNYLILGNGFQSTTTLGMVVHNAYLQIFSDLGIVAAVALLVIVFTPIRVGVKTIKVNPNIIPSVIVLIIFSFTLLLHPFSVQISDWAFYVIAFSLVMIQRKESRGLYYDATLRLEP